MKLLLSHKFLTRCLSTQCFRTVPLQSRFSPLITTVASIKNSVWLENREKNALLSWTDIKIHHVRCSVRKLSSHKKETETVVISPTIREIVGTISDIQPTRKEIDEPKWSIVDTKLSLYPKIYMSLSKWYLTCEYIVVWVISVYIFSRRLEHWSFVFHFP